MKNASSPQNSYILGLDLGTTSIGWAVVGCEVKLHKPSNTKSQKESIEYVPTTVHALNSRIFQEMVDAKTRVPKNQKRREMRGARRRLSFYKKRRSALIKLLQTNQLLPNQEYTSAIANQIDRSFAERVLEKSFGDGSDWSYQEKIHASPFAIRAYGIENQLTADEFSRALLHIQSKRGYFSNRGAKYLKLRNLFDDHHFDNPNDDQEIKDSDTKIVLKGLTALQQKMNEGNFRSLGEYIWQQALSSQKPAMRITKHSDNHLNKKGENENVQFFATREMIQTEFKVLWTAQEKHLPLSAELKEKIKTLIFYQTPLEESYQAKKKQIAELFELGKYQPRRKPQRANCVFEPDKKRTAKATLVYQEARTRQTINHLTFRGQSLSDEQRENLYRYCGEVEQLNDNGRLTWTKVAKILGGKSKDDINFSRSDVDGEDSQNGLIGNRTAQKICKSVGEGFWQQLSDEQRHQLVTDLLTIKDKKALYLRLIKYWNLPSGAGKEAHMLAETELETGYSKHAARTWSRLLPYLRKGDNYHDACINADYQHEYQKSIRQKGSISEDDVPQIANPIVQKALYEARRVVNKVIDKYGSPAVIRVEMAREMGNSKKHRIQIEKEQFKNRKINAESENMLIEKINAGELDGFNYENINADVKRIKPSDRNKYKMYHFEQNCNCPYCFRKIGMADLFNGGAEIEHILPQVYNSV